MERRIIPTADGSFTVFIPEMNVTYHSTHGAIQESMHVFIQAGLKSVLGKKAAIAVLEMGLGTGLNALLTLIEADKAQKPVHYTAIELFPLELQQISSLNYCQLLGREDLQPVFEKLHTADWGKEIIIGNNFTLLKSGTNLLEFEIPQPGHLFDIIYFDAFAPAAQPELWTQPVFEKLYAMVMPGGVLVTYCSKGTVRRAMQPAGFSVEKLAGPPGKREMVRARKEM